MSTNATAGGLNPFRVTSTGSSSASQALNTNRPLYAPPPGPPPPRSSDREPRARVSSPTSQPVPSTNSTGDVFRASENTTSSPAPEEAQHSQLPPPPPYSAAPNQFAGEATVEYGPLRPYHPAPPPLLVPVPAPQQSTWDSAESVPRVAPNTQLLPGSTSLASGAPPPRHPSQRPYRARPSNQSLSLSEAAADGSYRSTSVGLPADNSNPPSRRRNSYGSESTAQNRYAPPPGPPPSPGRRPSLPSGPPDDGKPTTSPIGGHPFLNGGRILVYPTGYECYKCNNIGYKNLDPSHPCRKCWQNYGKSYSGPYLFTDWKNPPPNYQRPLPKLTPPDRQPNQAQWIANPALQNRTETPSTSNSPDTVRPVVIRSGQPPPGALVVRPGDPRIGGKLCLYCGGEGILPGFLFFDEETCPACQGTGRIFGR